MNDRIDDIELLRGFAVLLVVVHHAQSNLITWTSPALTHFYHYFGGWVGVDLFFAVSGFVIARSLVPLLRSQPDNAAAWRATLGFWVRRAWRLLPSAWLWLLLILLACVAFNRSGVFGSLRANLEATVAALLQVANIRFAEVFMQREYGSSFVYWSLALEEQFYLLFPLLILFSRRWLPYVLLGLVALQLFSPRSVMLMMFRTDALALGVLIALWSARPSYRLLQPALLTRRWLGVGVLLALLLCLCVLGSEPLKLCSMRIGMIALVSAALVWMASYNRDYLWPEGVFKHLMIWFGTRSYAIYLIHIPAFLFTRELWFRLYPQQGEFGESFFYPFVFTAALLILLLSELNYRLIECPLRERGKHMVRRLFADADAEPAVRAEPAPSP